MGMSEGKGMLANAMKDLLVRWRQTQVEWHDAQAQRFEESFLTPLQADLRQAMIAMDQMSRLLDQIHRDCE